MFYDQDAEAISHMECGHCRMPIKFKVSQSSNSALWYHNHSSKWLCDDGLGDANTWQIRCTDS